MKPVILLAVCTLGVTLLTACQSATGFSAQPQLAEGHHQQASFATQPTLDPIRSGLMTQAEILAYPKFQRGYQSFTPDGDEINRFMLLKGNQWVIGFGLWCHDSQHHVPRLMKLLEAAGIAPNQIQWIAVGPDKQLPDALKEQFQLAKTPTVWLLKNNQIIATMIENPRGTLGEDLLSQVLH